MTKESGESKLKLVRDGEGYWALQSARAWDVVRMIQWIYIGDIESEEHKPQGITTSFRLVYQCSQAVRKVSTDFL